MNVFAYIAESLIDSSIVEIKCNVHLFDGCCLPPKTQRKFVSGSVALVSRDHLTWIMVCTLNYVNHKLIFLHLFRDMFRTDFFSHSSKYNLQFDSRD